MSGRAILFILTLWAAVASIGSFLFDSENAIRLALILIIAGLVVALVGVLVQQIMILVRSRHAREAAHPTKVKPKPPALGEDAAALDVLRREAMGRLSAAAGKRGTGFAGRTLFLVVGPSSSGKTQTLMNSGLDPQLLAGQVRGDSAVMSTRVANFWLAQEGIFVELSGRLYESDQERWVSLLMVLAGESQVPFWKRLFRDGQRPVLRGVLLFHDIQCAMAQPDGSLGAAQSRLAQERLRAVADVFGMAVPVYAVFAKADSVKFFGEYFGRLPQGEASEAFGYTLANDPPAPPSRPMPWAEREGRRLTKAFSIVYRRLAERRLLHLIRESDPSRKPDIYEFPREFRRIRGALVQLLADAFQPDPLKPGHELRGFYFTGTRMAEETGSDPTLLGLDTASRGLQRATASVDYSDATRIFQPSDFRVSGRDAPPASARRTLRQQWMFTKQLFLETIPKDLPPVVAAPAQSFLDKYRGWVTMSVAGLLLLIGMVWVRSWWHNKDHLRLAEDAIQAVEKAGIVKSQVPVNLAGLQAIDKVRKQMEELELNPWEMRWGLSKADEIRTVLARLYFRNLDVMLLSQLNQRIGSQLAALPATPDPSPLFEPTYERLATHLAMTSAPCKLPEPKVIWEVLTEEARAARLAEDPDRLRLAEAQFRYYAQTLPNDRPVQLAENPLGPRQAREYLGKVRSIDRIYEMILQMVSQKMPGSVRVDADVSAVLKGPTEVQALFTPLGWREFEAQSNAAPTIVQGDPCVLGTTSGLAADFKQDAELIRKVRILYLQRYKEEWKQFIKLQEFKGYTGREDAIGKLELLMGNKSPILAILALAAKNTGFSSQQADSSGLEQSIKKTVKKLEDLGKKSGAPIDKLLPPTEPEDSPTRMTKVFQPVHSVVPPGAQNWAGDKNKPYLDALAEFRGKLAEIERSGGSSSDPAPHQETARAGEKALDAVRQLSIGFASTGSEGVDSDVQNLLQAPIRKARTLYQDNPEKLQTGELTGALNKFCALARPILTKYPFNQASKIDASLEEVGRLFSPQTGALSELLQSPLADLLVKNEAGAWVAKPGTQKPKAAPELVRFLNRAQSFSDILYGGIAGKLNLRYEIRPVGKLPEGLGIVMEFDGVRREWNGSPFQKSFVWPASPGSTPGALAWISLGGGKMYFGGGRGPWGVFRVFRDADSRVQGSLSIQWSNQQVAGGESVALDQPVRMEFTNTSRMAADILNPKFFDGFDCPRRAVQ